MNLKKISESGNKFLVVTTDGEEYIVVHMNYIWPDDNEACGGCEAIIVDTEGGDFFQINGPDIQSIDILE